MIPAKKTILFIEDEPDLIDIYHTIFENHDYKFLSTADIEEGMIIAQKEKIDAILLDLVLPKEVGSTVDLSAKQGFIFLEKVKKNSKTKNIPVIILTNLNNSNDRKRARDLGVVDYIVKADHLPEAIFSKVERIINKK